MSKIEEKEGFRPVTTIEMVDAIELLIGLFVERKGWLVEGWPQSDRDRREIARRIIADGLRYHSAGKGIVAGTQ